MEWIPDQHGLGGVLLDIGNSNLSFKIDIDTKIPANDENEEIVIFKQSMK